MEYLEGTDVSTLIGKKSMRLPRPSISRFSCVVLSISLTKMVSCTVT